MSQTSSIAVEQPRARSNKLVWFLLLAGRLLLGVIFIVAAYGKIHYDGAWHFNDYYFFFAMNVDSYGMLPLWGVEWMARILPWLELVLGVLLIVGVGLRWTASLTTALYVMFMVALAHAVMNELPINCGCFGKSSATPQHELLQDSFLLPVAIAVTVGAFLAYHRFRSAKS